MKNIDFPGIYISSLIKQDINKETMYNKKEQWVLLFIDRGSGKVEDEKLCENYCEEQVILSEKTINMVPKNSTIIYLATLENTLNITKAGIYSPNDSEGSRNFFRSIERDLSASLNDIETHSLKVYQYIIQLGKNELKAENQLIQNTLDVIHSEYSSLDGVEELADIVGVNKSYLIREFKKKLNITPGRYIEKIRIDRAVLLMAHNNYSLELIAGMVGFSSGNYFGRVFKKLKGLTPNQFRTTMSKEKLNQTDQQIIREIESAYLV